MKKYEKSYIIIIFFMENSIESMRAAGEACPDSSDTGAGTVLDPVSPFVKAEAAERFAHRFQHSYSQAGSFGKTLLEAAAQTLPLGSGAEKIVYEFGANKVAAILAPYSPEHSNKDYSPEVMKRKFYERKLLNLLAPESIPDIHMAGTSPPMLILDRVHRAGSRDEVAVAIERKTRFGRKDPQSELSALGLRIDPTGDNLILDKGGNTVYVDNPMGKLNKQALVEAIDALSDLDKKRALKYLSRLKEHGAEFAADEENENLELAA